MIQPVYKTIYLYMTHACNSGCSFCYRKGLYKRHKVSELGPYSRMSKEMAFDILDFVFSKLKTDKQFAIYFWGGEPTLEMEVIKSVIGEYPQFPYHTNTNGGTMTREMFSFIQNTRNFSLTWSFGNAYENFGGVKEKAAAEPLMVEMLKDNRHNINFMVTRYDRLLEDYRWIAENLTDNITIDIATRFDHKEKDLEEFARQYLALMNYYKDDPRIFNGLNPALHSNLYFREFGMKAQVTDFHYCRSGLERLFIDMNGGIWQCDNMYICQHNKLGDIWDGLDYSKLEFALEIDQDREKYLGRHCESCELYKQCPRNKCLGLNLEHMGDMFIPEPAFCNMCKVLFKVTKAYIEIEKSKEVVKWDAQGMNVMSQAKAIR